MDTHPTAPRRPSALRRWSRRLLVAVLALALVATGGVAVVYASAKVSTVGELAFQTPLRIPPLLEPSIDKPGRKHFELTLQAGTTEFLPGTRTTTWGVNGSYLGPTLRASRGDTVSVDVENRLPESTTLHWHGMRLPARMDGGPHQMIEPGETWRPRWTVDQPAASLWYHPHLHGRTAEHVNRGVSGMFLLDDDNSSSLELPSRYGVDDIPLIVQDRSFADDGSFELTPDLMSQFGSLGDTILVNGTHDPFLRVRTTRVRLRVLNAANARSFAIGFADDRSFQLVGTDSGLLDTPVELDRVRLSPGERAEIVAEFRPGEPAVLRSFAPEEAGSFPMARFAGAHDEFDLLRIMPADTLRESPPVPSRLANTPQLSAADATRTREFTMGGTSKINGERMDMRRIDEVVPAGATEIWSIRNPGTPHSFHIHEVAFRVLSIDGGPPPVYARGRKDTVYLPPDSRVRLLVRFGPHADPDWPYMYHCHMLEHEDAGMMGQFVIVEPGTEDTVSRTLPPREHHR